MTTAARVLDRATLAALVLLFVGGARAGALREPIEDAARRNFAEYLELLRYRNVADVRASRSARTKQRCACRWTQA
jgi:hypothetical protein